jgi:hypothetical protein
MIFSDLPNHQAAITAKHGLRAGGKPASTLRSKRGSGLFRIVLKRDDSRANHHRALAHCLRMIFSENRDTLFRIMR